MIHDSFHFFLFRFCPSPAALLTISLIGNDFTAEDGKAIGEALKTNMCLMTLEYVLTPYILRPVRAASLSSVSCNNLGPDGGRAIAEALKTNTSLTNLE